MKKTNKIKKIFKKEQIRKNGLFVVMLVLVFGGLYFYAQSTEAPNVPDIPDISDNPNVPNIPGTPIKTPEQTYVPAPSDRGQSFTVSSSDKSGPRLVSFFIDPFDPEVGQEQLGSVYVKDSEPVTSVVMTIITDNKSVAYELQLVNGTELDGHWQGSWVVDDTNDDIYEIPISATSSRGTSEVHVTLK